jgi:hypothetical protein
MNMRLENEKPVSAVELAIEQILVEQGFDANEIQFRGDDRYLRVGYWKSLDREALFKLGDLIGEEIPMYDDDCGWLFCYSLNH